MLFDDWLASLCSQSRTHYLWMLVKKQTKYPIYVVDVDGLDISSVEYTKIVEWLETHYAADWCEISGQTWATVDLIGFQDAAIAAEFKLIYGK